MIDMAEILPYIFMFIGFVTMVIVARYRPDIFTEENTNITVSKTATNIPVDRIESPYRINIEDTRSTLKGRLMTNVYYCFFFVYETFLRWSLYSTSYTNIMSITCILVCKYSKILFRIRFKRFSIIFI